MTDSLTRKSQHLDIVLRRDVGARAVTTGFEAIRFEHVALPELALADIDLSTMFLGRRLAAPLLVSSMTGGPERADAINYQPGDVLEFGGMDEAIEVLDIAVIGG